MDEVLHGSYQVSHGARQESRLYENTVYHIEASKIFNGNQLLHKFRNIGYFPNGLSANPMQIQYDNQDIIGAIQMHMAGADLLDDTVVPIDRPEKTIKKIVLGRIIPCQNKLHRRTAFCFPLFIVLSLILALVSGQGSARHSDCQHEALQGKRA